MSMFPRSTPVRIARRRDATPAHIWVRPRDQPARRQAEKLSPRTEPDRGDVGVGGAERAPRDRTRTTGRDGVELALLLDRSRAPLVPAHAVAGDPGDRRSALEALVITDTDDGVTDRNHVGHPRETAGMFTRRLVR